MNEKVDTSPPRPSGFDRFEQVAKTLSMVAIPIVLAVGGWILQHALSEQSVNKDYVQLAVSILTKSDEAVAPSLREWAVQLLNDKSSVKFDPSVVRELSAGEIQLPGRIFARGGVAYEERFIAELFSEWNEATELTPKFKAILVEMADAFLKERWPQLATFFEPKYYNEQVSFLGTGRLSREGIVEIMRQFVQEALQGTFDGTRTPIYSVALERVAKIRFLDIVNSDWGDDYAEIRFRLVMDDGTAYETGYVFVRDSYFFVGGVG